MRMYLNKMIWKHIAIIWLLSKINYDSKGQHELAILNLSEVNVECANQEFGGRIN